MARQLGKALVLIELIGRLVIIRLKIDPGQATLFYILLYKLQETRSHSLPLTVRIHKQLVKVIFQSLPPVLYLADGDRAQLSVPNIIKLNRYQKGTLQNKNLGKA